MAEHPWMMPRRAHVRGALTIVMTVVSSLLVVAAPTPAGATGIATISGTVSGPTGPIAGATVDGIDLDHLLASTTTDEHGRYTLRFELDSSIWVGVRAQPPAGSSFIGAGYIAGDSGSGPIEYGLSPGDAKTGWNIKLTLGYRIDATVQAETGRPNTDASVQPIACEAPSYPGTSPSMMAPCLAGIHTWGAAITRRDLVDPAHLVLYVPAGTYYLAVRVLRQGTVIQSADVLVSVGPGLATPSCVFRLVGPANCDGTPLPRPQPPDDDGVDPDIEFGAVPGGDGNLDGVLDSLQSHVASFPAGGGGVTLLAPFADDLHGVTASEIPSGSTPDAASAPIGQVSFTVTGLVPGDAADITLFTTLQGDLWNTYYQHRGDAWDELPSDLVTFTPTSITVHLFDGGTFDLDGAVNGSIASAGAPMQHGNSHTDEDAPAIAPLQPARILDSRTGPGADTVDGYALATGALTPGVWQLMVGGRGGIPSDAAGAVLNVAVTGPTSPGYLTVFPCGPQPVSANLNFAAGQTISNGAVTKIGPGGWVCFFVSATTDLVVDVDGFVPAPSQFRPVTPQRLLDTRDDGTSETVDGASSGLGIRPAGSMTELQVAGRGDVPPNTHAVSLNVAVTGATSAGYITIFPCGQPVPNAANLNYRAGETISNNVVARLSLSGTVCVFSYGTAHVVIDVNGAMADGRLTAMSPARLLETRSGPGLGTIDGALSGGGRVAAGSVVELPVLDRAGVPSATTAVILNVTVVDPAAAGFLTVYPCGHPRPNAANLNYVAGQTIANSVLATVGDGGRVCIFSLAATDLVVDVDGYNVQSFVVG